MLMNARFVFALLLLAPLAHAQVSSENNDRLREALTRYPEADANKDGVLTMEEGLAYLAKRKGKKGAAPEKMPADALKPDVVNVAYGPHERDRLDLYLAKGSEGKNTPLVVLIHGGGFRAGDKSKWATDKGAKELIAQGISCAALNYPFLDHMPVQDILRHCARAVQFLRSRSGEWKLDKTRFAAMGGSAGAGTSLWLATHDDLADPKAEDPVLRESTRLSCAVCNSTQATYDVTRWESFLGAPKPEFRTSETEAAMFYHLPSFTELASEKGRAILKECDMLSWITKDDPPLFISNAQVVEAPSNRGEWLHCIHHAREIHKHCEAAGVPCVVAQDATEEKLSSTVFLVRHLNGMK